MLSQSKKAFPFPDISFSLPSLFILYGTRFSFQERNNSNVRRAARRSSTGRGSPCAARLGARAEGRPQDEAPQLTSACRWRRRSVLRARRARPGCGQSGCGAGIGAERFGSGVRLQSCAGTARLLSSSQISNFQLLCVWHFLSPREGRCDRPPQWKTFS